MPHIVFLILLLTMPIPSELKKQKSNSTIDYSSFIQFIKEPEFIFVPIDDRGRTYQWYIEAVIENNSDYYLNPSIIFNLYLEDDINYGACSLYDIGRVGHNQFGILPNEKILISCKGGFVTKDLKVKQITKQVIVEKADKPAIAPIDIINTWQEPKGDVQTNKQYYEFNTYSKLRSRSKTILLIDPFFLFYDKENVRVGACMGYGDVLHPKKDIIVECMERTTIILEQPATIKTIVYSENIRR